MNAIDTGTLSMLPGEDLLDLTSVHSELAAVREPRHHADVLSGLLRKLFQDLPLHQRFGRVGDPAPMPLQCPKKVILSLVDAGQHNLFLRNLFPLADPQLSK